MSCLNCRGPMPLVQPDSGKRARKHCSQKCCNTYASTRRVRAKRPSQHKGSHIPVTDEALAVFWSRVDKTEDCWIWTGARNGDGYGYFSLRGYSARAHRWSYELCNGPIPLGAVTDHLCRNRLCVRPDHLELVTPKENVVRGWEAGRTPCNRRLTAGQVVAIRALYASGGWTYGALAERYSVSRGLIGQIIRRVAWKGVA